MLHRVLRLDVVAGDDLNWGKSTCQRFGNTLFAATAAVFQRVRTQIPCTGWRRALAAVPGQGWLTEGQARDLSARRVAVQGGSGAFANRTEG